MIISITLIVQIINFWCAYILLRYLLYGPVLTQISDEDLVKQQSLDDLKGHKDKLALTELQTKQQWREYRSIFFKNKKQFPFDVHVSEQSMEEKSIPEAVIKKVEKELSAFAMKKAEDAP
jgi:hypothetical protein